jgi:hypothetical protein
MGSLVSPVVYEGRLVALAGRTRCHVICPDLSEQELRVVLLMCCFVGRALRSGDASDGLNQEAEAWAASLVVGGRPVSRPRRA